MALSFLEFVLAYAGGDQRSFCNPGILRTNIPKEVLLRWKGQDSMVHAQILMTNTPFQIEVPKAPLQNAVTGGAVR